jgi:hypothetical protein
MTTMRLTDPMRRSLTEIEDAGVLHGGHRLTPTIRALEARGLIKITPDGAVHPWQSGWTATITAAGITTLTILDAQTPAEPSVYRCADCGHGRRLSAWAHANLYGPLGADGEISEYDGIEPWEDPIEESIDCSRHPGAIIEKFTNGEWCRWWRCPKCGGLGYLTYGPTFGGHRKQCGAPGYKGQHDCWRPLSDYPPGADSLDHDGHVFTRGHGRCCRRCAAAEDSATGEAPCAGEGHHCPAVVTEGATPTASRVYGHDEFFCFQPGTMSDDFTTWTCGAGHILTAGHVPDTTRHEAVCPMAGLRCPWPFLLTGA